MRKYLVGFLMFSTIGFANVPDPIFVEFSEDKCKLTSDHKIYLNHVIIEVLALMHENKFSCDIQLMSTYKTLSDNYSIPFYVRRATVVLDYIVRTFESDFTDVSALVQTHKIVEGTDRYNKEGVYVFLRITGDISTP